MLNYKKGRFSMSVSHFYEADVHMETRGEGV